MSGPAVLGKIKIVRTGKGGGIEKVCQSAGTRTFCIHFSVNLLTGCNKVGSIRHAPSHATHDMVSSHMYSGT